MTGKPGAAAHEMDSESDSREVRKGSDTHFTTEMVLEQSDIMKISLDADLTLVTKTDSQGITDLNVQYETIELLEDMEEQT